MFLDGRSNRIQTEIQTEIQQRSDTNVYFINK